MSSGRIPTECSLFRVWIVFGWRVLNYLTLRLPLAIAIEYHYFHYVQLSFRAGGFSQDPQFHIENNIVYRGIFTKGINTPQLFAKFTIFDIKVSIWLFILFSWPCI